MLKQNAGFKGTVPAVLFQKQYYRAEIVLVVVFHLSSKFLNGSVTFYGSIHKEYKVHFYSFTFHNTCSEHVLMKST